MKVHGTEEARKQQTQSNGMSYISSLATASQLVQVALKCLHGGISSKIY